MLTMEPNHFLRPIGTAAGRLKQIREAKEMEKAVLERAQRLEIQPPPYKFLELIGKGSFGRVFKSQRHGEKALFAVKIIDIDSTDYTLRPTEREQAIKDFISEISILNTLKDSKAKNINTIHEAISFHSQLWIVSEYCPGGSVHTLMKASPKPGLEERFTITISRELAIAMKYVHDAGIIHRDIKAANILITEDGHLQLCDFGVSGVLESSVAKRSTVIGTPFWMAPELLGDPKDLSYGTEIDCWAFGCTVYELATGQPPNARINPHKLHMFLQKAPKLEGDEYSAALREFVSFCLEERPKSRPSAIEILKHSFIANTSLKYPTPMLKELLQRYAHWEQLGGQRQSLFNPYGAAGPESLDPVSADEDDWNFSVTDEFDQDMIKRYSMHQTTPSTSSRASSETKELRSNQSSKSSKTSTAWNMAREEQRVLRGGMKIERIFDTSLPKYEYANGEEEEESFNDLPLRSISSHSANRETIIDLDMAQDLSDVPSLDMVDVPTIKAQRTNRFYQDDDDEDVEVENQRQYDQETKRLTREWKYPAPLTMPNQERPKTQEWSMAQAMREIEFDSTSTDDRTGIAAPSAAALAPAFRPTLKHTITEPLGNFGDFMHPSTSRKSSLTPSLSLEPPDRASFYDIDPAYISRPSTAASSTGESVMTELTTGDPFDLDDNMNTVRLSQRASFHIHSQSEPTPADRIGGSPPFLGNHYRGESTFSSDSEWERNRPISVHNSIAELREVGDAEDYWSQALLPRFQTQVSPPQGRQPFLAAPGGPAYEDGNWTTYDPEVNPIPVIDLDMADVPDAAPIMKQNINTGLGLDVLTTGTSKPASLRFRNHSRGRTSGLTNNINGSLSNGENVTRSLFLKSPFDVKIDSKAKHKRVVAFPYPSGPDCAALDEEANHEVVVAELERLLDDFMIGLRVAGNLVGGGAVNEGVGS